MARIIYPSRNMRELYGLPVNLADPFLLENTLCKLNPYHRSIWIYDHGGRHESKEEIVVDVFKNCFFQGGKSDTITVWHDIIDLPKKNCINTKTKKFLFYKIINDYIYTVYHEPDNKYYVICNIFQNSNGDHVVILSICTISYNTFIPLNIKPGELYRKAMILKNIISKYTNNHNKVGYVSSESIEYSYADFKTATDIIIFY